MNTIPETFKGAALVKVWTYRGTQGEELAKVARYDHLDGRKEVIPYRPEAGGWKAGALPEPRHLFNLHSLTHAAPKRPILIVEGEKCAAALASIDLLATTWQGGGKAADKADWDPLSGHQRVYLLPDNDQPGEAAARAVAAILATLRRPPETLIVRIPGLPEGGGDVVDWLQARCPGWDGFEPVPEPERARLKEELQQAIKAHAIPVPEEWTQGEAWPELQELVASLSPEAYPLDALPELVRNAVEEVARYTQAPLPMVASCALAALALVIQPHIDVRRAARLIGPVTLFLLTIADSGERKTTVDTLFTQAVREWERAAREAMASEIKQTQANKGAWQAKMDGVKSKIKDLAKQGKPTDQQERELRALAEQEPEEPPVPKLLLEDETPQNLAWRLAKLWPSSGVLSSEAGTVLGAHGMKSDSVMQNLALLNKLWDGGSHSIGRRTSESFDVYGVRLTIGLQVQEATLHGFFDQAGDLARGTGFLARFMVCWPESTQGGRKFKEPPERWPALERFNARITEILNEPLPIDEESGILRPALVGLSPEAKGQWIAFHDAIEEELGEGGDLRDLRDIASKTADNAARLAALFQYFERGPGAVDGDLFEGASRVAAWHLNEARRFFGELHLSPEIAAAARLEEWLLKYARAKGLERVRTTEVQQYGPGPLRRKPVLNAALVELEEAGRVRVIPEGRSRFIEIRPELLGGDLRAAA